MQQRRRNVTAVLPTVAVTTVVLSLTGGLLGVMAYNGSVTPAVWVLAVVLGVGGRDRFPRSGAPWRGPATVLSLFVAGGVLGAIAYYGALGWAPAFAAACLAALASAPPEAV